MFNRPDAILGSGLAIAESYLSGALRFTYPYVKPGTLEVVQAVTGSAVNSFVAGFNKAPNVIAVHEPTLSTYAGKLFDIAYSIKASAYDIVLCPLRGARMAGVHVDLVCETEPVRAFDGSDMAQRTNDERILGELHRLIWDLPLRSERRELAVLDTAKGGDSCREMTRLLRQLHERRQEQWAVTFHLIHAEGQQPPRARQAFDFRCDTFAVTITYHPVTELLIEDEAKLLGYDIVRGGGQSRIIPFQQDGQILLYGLREAKLFRAAPLDESLLALVSDLMAEHMLTMPDIKPVNLDHWPYGR